MKRGSRGSETALLQLGLVRTGDLKGEIDGVFGPLTENALRAFQRREGIAQDGIAGEESWKRIAPFLCGYRVVRIREGDTYFKIAEAFQTSREAVEGANPGYDAENLPVGGELVVPLGFELVPDGVPMSSSFSAFLTAGLAARYPFIESKSVGKSGAGRPLMCLTVGEGGKKVHFGAAIHANEWITSLLLFRFLEEYGRAILADDRIEGIPARSLFRDTRLTVTPLENPDGCDLVTGAFPPGTLLNGARRIASAYPSIAFPAGWKADIHGVDLNLQFPAGWEDARRIKFAAGFRTPAPRDYVGRAPRAAPEAEALAGLTEKEAFDRILSFHTQGGVIYWRYGNRDPEGARELGEKLSAASGYPLAEPPLASSYAGYKDWFIDRFAKPGYTFEAGNGTNPLPLAAFPDLYARIKPALVTALTE